VHKYRPVSRYGSQVQRKPDRRSAPKLAFVQIFGLLAMLVFAMATVGVVMAPGFEVATMELHGAKFTSGEIVKQILGLDSSPNVFRIQTDRAADQLVRLPAVQSATVEIRLPSTVVVRLVERKPRMVWVIGANRYVVDQDGMMFGLVDAAGNPIPSNAGPLPTPTEPVLDTPTPLPSGSGSDASAGASAEESPTPTPEPTPEPSTPAPTPAKATASKGGKAKPTPVPTPTPSPTIDPSLLPSIAPPPTPATSASRGPQVEDLPTVFDRRASDAGLELGDEIDPINLDAGYRLGGLTPADVGSAAGALGVVVDDVHGFTLSPVPPAWVAEFGFYAPTVRKTTIIPGQVRDLRSALGQLGETHIAWVRLVADVSTNQTITVIPR
jgi:hypothetical protein